MYYRTSGCRRGIIQTLHMFSGLGTGIRQIFHYLRDAGGILYHINISLFMVGGGGSREYCINIPLLMVGRKVGNTA
jgi:hypothetical protein